ncbi:unnamed protein product [Dovyalis caffra]|uniref:Aquaporin n=1 Tax=Dovyalis caffra TaxID=77055 RepID=A0AAV1SVB0_9ROSI|nr:unnamed protein product [Dovyalis caffra]
MLESEAGIPVVSASNANGDAGRATVGAEFVGTFILVFAAAAAGPIVNQKYNQFAETLIGNAAVSGLAVMMHSSVHRTHLRSSI